jgi:GntR family transcriptional regulator
MSTRSLAGDSGANVSRRSQTIDQLGPSGAALRRKALPRQLRDSIAALIVDEMQPGDPLPSEKTFAERLMVSRSTVREAMKLLEQEGLVETRRGTGRFASALSGLRPERPMTKFESITKMMAELGYDSTTQVVSVETRPSTPSEQLALTLEPGSKVIETRRLREHQSIPCIYSVNVLDPRTVNFDFGDIDWSDSVVLILERMGHEIVASSAHISVVSAPLTEDALAQISPEVGPWLMVNEQCVTRLGRCVLISRDYHLGSMFSFSVVRRREEDFGVSGPA